MCLKCWVTPIKQDNQAKITKIELGKVVASRKKHPTLLKRQHNKQDLWRKRCGAFMWSA